MTITHRKPLARSSTRSVRAPLGAILLGAAFAACGGSDGGGNGGAGAPGGGSAGLGAGGVPSGGSAGTTVPGGGTPSGGISGTPSGGTGGTPPGGSGGTSGAGPLGGAGSGGAGPLGGAGFGGTGGAGVAGGGTSSGGAGAGGTAGTTGGAGAGGSGGTTSCMTPPAPGPLIGWAATGSGTTGGGNVAPVVVTTAAALNTNLAGTTARVIHVSGNLTGNFSVGSNKTVIGVCGATLRGHVGISGSSNVIFRNLRVVGNNCTDSPADCSGGADAIGVGNGAHHIWFDHLDVSDGSDGNLDITNGSDFVTVSWTKFSYSSRRTDPLAGASGHRFSNLIGGADNVAIDAGKLNVTWHHNWWADNVDQRMPRTRAGHIHVFNNLYTSSGNSYCTNAGWDTRVLVQNNVYIGVNRPFDVSTYPAPNNVHNGNMFAEGNVTTGSTSVTLPSGSRVTPSYTFQLDATSGLEAAIRSGAGPR